MNLEYEKRLEGEIDRELKALPPLSAPRTLVSRVMAAIETRTVHSSLWRAWPAWPLALRAASLMALLALFGGLCYAGWELSHAGSEMVARRFGGGLSLLGAMCDALSALLGALALAFKQLSVMVLIGYLAALTFGYVICLGLGTLGMKVALARR